MLLSDLVIAYQTYNIVVSKSPKVDTMFVMFRVEQEHHLLSRDIGNFFTVILSSLYKSKCKTICFK